jgi:hypothetical protein
MPRQASAAHTENSSEGMSEVFGPNRSPTRAIGRDPDTHAPPAGEQRTVSVSRGVLCRNTQELIDRSLAVTRREDTTKEPPTQ